MSRPDQQTNRHRPPPGGPPDDPPARPQVWQARIFAVTWLAYAGFYLTRKAVSIAKIELQKPEVMALSTETLSVIDGGYLAAYAGGQFLWGILSDRFGTRVVVLTGMAGSIAVAVATGLASSTVALGSCFALQGICQSSGWRPWPRILVSFSPAASAAG